MKLSTCKALMNVPTLSNTMLCSISTLSNYHYHNHDNFYQKNKILSNHKYRRNAFTQLNARLSKSSFRNHNTMANSLIFMNVLCFLLGINLCSSV